MESQEEFDGFDPRIQTAVDGLIYLGEVSQDFEFCGHTFGMRTLRPNEEIAASAVVHQFKGTLKEPEAWMAAQVGLALTHIDNDEAFCPQAGPDMTSFAKARFNYVTSNWYWPTIDFLFQGYGKLLDRQVKAIRAVQDLSQGSLHTSMPSASSFNLPGILSDETLSETPS